MTFEPEPGTRIHLKNDEVIEFVALEESGPASVFVYAESGKEGTVYKVLKNKEQFALKVFYPQYRDKRLLENTDKLSRFKDLEGFRVAKRTVLTPEGYPNLLNQYPDLTFAVLMPWIEGTVWGNLMLENDTSLQPENYIQIAHALTRVVSSLELQGLAHCDLSSNNFIIAKSPYGIQLIDIEDMYAPDMPRPIPDVSYGSIGYRTRWIAEKGLWGPESDRFSIAVLCAEIIAWSHAEIRENKSGSTSFFEEDEIGENSDRYKLMIDHLSRQSEELPALLEQAWFAREFTDCPTIAEWRDAVRKMQIRIAPEPSPYVEDQANIATIIRKRNVFNQKPGETVVEPDSLPVEEEQPQPEPVASHENGDKVENQLQEQAPPATEAELLPDVEEQIPTEEVIQEQIDTTIPMGVPPGMDISLEILDFGTLGKGESSQQFSISNSGGASLSVSIQAEEWIDVVPKDFVILPGETRSIKASMNQKYPKPKTGGEYRTASALTIESTIGNEVIGAKYNVAKPSFRESAWKRALLGAVLGTILGCPVALGAGFDSNAVVAMFIILSLCVLGALLAGPRK
jgi:tRNA A-37 threonylcarbamoyl transferase component Bud32